MSSPPRHLFVPLIFLEDPPENHHPDEAIADKWRVIEWKAIVDYHGYGFAYDLPTKVVKADLINVFRKIAYNSQGYKVARCSGDVGPGLLKDGILARLGLSVPAAQWTVTEADIRNYFTIPDYLLRVPVPKVKRPNDPISIKPTSGFPTITRASSNQSQGSQTGPQTTGSQPLNSQGSSLTARSTLSRAEVMLTEPIKQALINSAYRSLDRHEAAFPLTPRPFLDANSGNDLRQVVKFSHSASATIKLTWTEGGTQCALDPNGRIHTYHGKGPVWSGNSCWMDSVIVAGMLLQAGSTVADRGGEANWEQSLDASGRMYLDTLSMNWDGFTNQDSIIHRDLFRKSYNDNYNTAHGRETVQLAMNSYYAPAIFWEDVAKNFHQFRYRYERRSGCDCSPDKITKSKPRWANSISPPPVQTEGCATSMQNLMQATFMSTKQCLQCKEDKMFTDRVVHDDLPLRLVVILDTRPSLTMPTGHTDDISFEYERIPMEQEATLRSTAVYRWLGGVYYSPNREHFRVYWTDNERGEPGTNRVRVYDGQMAGGAIIGGFTIHDNKSNKLDREWTTRPANLLFYERIVFPTSGALEAVSKAVTDIQSAKCNGNPSLIRWRPRVQPGKQKIYKRSLQPYFFKDAEYSAMRTFGVQIVPLEQKDFPAHPDKAVAVTPEHRVLPSPPPPGPTGAGAVGEYIGTSNPGNGTDSIVLSSDDEETMPIPTPAPSNTDMTHAGSVKLGNAGNDSAHVPDADDGNPSAQTPVPLPWDTFVPNATDLALPPHIPEDQELGTQQVQRPKRTEPDSGQDESGRPGKLPNTGGRSGDDSTANMSPSTTAAKSRPDVLDMSEEQLARLFEPTS